MNTKDVTKKGLLGLDFGTTAFRIGAESVHCDGRWMQLSQDDMTVLHAVLTRTFGRDQVSATTESPALEMIAAWCAAGVQWMRAQESDKDLQAG